LFITSISLTTALHTTPLSPWRGAGGEAFFSRPLMPKPKFPPLLIAMLLPLACTLLSSCGKVENEFSDRRAYFIFDNQVQNNAVLASAMSPHSNVFVTVSMQTRYSGQNSYVEFNFVAGGDGAQQASKATAVDQNRGVVLGINNGLILGYGLLSDPPVFYAYDLQCPNCYSSTAVPRRSYPLTLQANGFATCANCRRKYNLSTGGNVAEGAQGNKLIRYRASTTGPYGLLVVN
jgi:lipoprotein